MESGNNINIWLAGVVPYEVTGVESVLAKYSVSGRRINSETRFTSGDVFILCLGSTPLIGWWRYLRIIKWLESRYEIKLIVLCPEIIYSMNIFCGKKVTFLNIESFSDSVLNFLWYAPEEEYKEKWIDRFWLYAVMCLREDPSVEVKGNLAKRAYHRRCILLRKLNLSSIHLLRVFMSGIKIKI